MNSVVFVLVLISGAGHIVPPQDSQSFEAVHVELRNRRGPAGRALSVGTFTLVGPDRDSLIRLPRRVRHVARSKAHRALYGIGTHQVFRITEGKTVDITPRRNDIPEFSWAVGLAYDTKRDRLIVVTLGGVGHIYAYSPGSETWAVVSDMDNIDVCSVCYDAEKDHLVALHYNRRSRRLELLRLSSAGRLVGRQSLQAPANLVDRVEAGGHGPHIQLLPNKSKITLISSPNRSRAPKNDSGESIIFSVDSTTGQTELKAKY